jgi:formylglycine-generating enzyme required for sulfatase activity
MEATTGKAQAAANNRFTIPLHLEIQAGSLAEAEQIAALAIQYGAEETAHNTPPAGLISWEPGKGKQLFDDAFITCPETTLPCGIVVPAFQVGQYATTRSDDGKLTINHVDAPWVEINYHEARAESEKAGYRLITELQWLALAYNASQVAANWTGGAVGNGELFQGIRNDNVDSAQPGEYVSTDSSERRWLLLSNGERIFDLNGNLYQWVFDDVQGDESGVIARAFSKDSPTVTTAPYPSRTHGMGDTSIGSGNWSGDALIRGGCWGSESRAGAFYLGGVWPVVRDSSVGFRCTKPIGL